MININMVCSSDEKYLFSSPGSSGIPLRLVTNLFSLDLPQDWQLYQYHVTYSPDLASRRLKMALLYSHSKLSDKTKAFDGTSLFLSEKLDQKVQCGQYFTLCVRVCMDIFAYYVCAEKILDFLDNLKECFPCPLPCLRAQRFPKMSLLMS